MTSLPPPPKGAQDVEPHELFEALGINITSGFRDKKKNRAVDGVPNSKHLDADALDLTPAKGMSWGDLRQHAERVARNWGNGARVVDESRTRKPHIHLQLPGWGKAPGLPPPPPGAVDVDAPDPPPGFELAQ